MSTGLLCIAGFLSGVAASMGLGGGFVLFIFLGLFSELPQLEMQLLNLLFFLPVSALAVLLHLKSRLIEKRVLLGTVAAGIAGVAIGAFLSAYLPETLLKKLFGGFLLLVGCKEVLHKR